MTSIVEICNLALSDIRAGSINSLTEGTLQAQLCSLKYPLLRDRMLTDTAWGFNQRVEGLALLTDDLFSWVYAYQYPADCLHIERLISGQEEITSDSPYRYDEVLPVSNLRVPVAYDVFNIDNNRVIGANVADLRVSYRVRVTDPNLFNTDFVMALSKLLASELAIPIVGAEVGRQLRSDSLSLYNQYVNSAIAKDMNESHHDQPLSEFETIRR